MSGVISWFVHNPVAANLLMLILVVGGMFLLAKATWEIHHNLEGDLAKGGGSGRAASTRRCRPRASARSGRTTGCTAADRRSCSSTGS